MAWTSPKTWATGDIVHVSDMNTYIRDNQRMMAPHLATSKGDLFPADASTTPVRLAVGSNGQLLRGASGAPSANVQWSNDKVPTGNTMIALFTGACPSGWTEYTAARGRAIVGVPSGGTVAGTVGTALTNLQNPTHTHTGPSHTHTITVSSDINLGGVQTRLTSTTTGASGTGATGAASLGDSMPYIQLTLCSKD